MSRHCNLSSVLQCYHTAPSRSLLFHLGLFHVDVMKSLLVQKKDDVSPMVKPQDNPWDGERWEWGEKPRWDFAKSRRLTGMQSWARHILLPETDFCSLALHWQNSFPLLSQQRKCHVTQLITHQKSPGLSLSPREDSPINYFCPGTVFQAKLVYFHTAIPLLQKMGQPWDSNICRWEPVF